MSNTFVWTACAFVFAIAAWLALRGARALWLGRGDEAVRGEAATLGWLLGAGLAIGIASDYSGGLRAIAWTAVAMTGAFGMLALTFRAVTLWQGRTRPDDVDGLYAMVPLACFAIAWPLRPELVGALGPLMLGVCAFTGIAMLALGSPRQVFGRLSIGALFISVLGLGMIAFGIHAYATTRGPVPETLSVANGKVRSAEAFMDGGEVTGFSMQLEGDSRRYAYSNIFRDGAQAWEAFERGTPARVEYLDDGSERPEVYSIAFDGCPVLTVAHAHAARRRNGNSGLGVALMGLLCAVGMIWQDLRGKS